jgi:hypothetical protein
VGQFEISLSKADRYDGEMAKVFKIAAIVSAVLFVLSLAMFVAGWHFDASEHWIHVKEDLNIGLVHRGDFDTGLAFFCDSGPYNGGTITLTSKGSPSPYEVKQYFNAPGIYYRYFRFKTWTSREVIWVLRISLWYALVAFSVLPLIWLVKTLRNRANQKSAISN